MILIHSTLTMRNKMTLNNNMTENTTPELKPVLTEVKPVADKLPDDLSGVHIESKIRIFDPESGKVIVEGRA